jgi:F-type H+-transporting ATPase subunit delta
MGNVAIRYARALFSTGTEEENGNEIRYGQLLESINQNISDSTELHRFLIAPLSSKSEKKRFLASVFTSSDDAHFLAFMKILVDKNRLCIVNEILGEYRKLILESQNIIEAVIESAYPLDSSTISAILDTFTKKTGAKEIHATVLTKPELVGGVRVIIGSKIYDGTTKSELDRLYETMRK